MRKRLTISTDRQRALSASTVAAILVLLLLAVTIDFLVFGVIDRWVDDTARAWDGYRAAEEVLHLNGPDGQIFHLSADGAVIRISQRYKRPEYVERISARIRSAIIAAAAPKVRVLGVSHSALGLLVFVTGVAMTVGGLYVDFQQKRARRGRS